MKPEFNSNSRIAVIEIGSRAVRLMIADASKETGFRIAASAWEETFLAAAVKLGGDSLRAKLNEIKSIVGRFKERSVQQNATQICVFATAAFREMPEDFVTYFRVQVPDIQILDKMAESGCSLLGAINEFKASASAENHLVIDQGTGSMEVVWGHVAGSGVKLLDFKSYPLGTQNLVQSLAEAQHDFKKFRSSLTKGIAKRKPIGTGFTGRLVILGSTATKIAWIKVRKSADQNYDPALAHGQVIDCKVVEALIDLAIRDPDAVKYMISPKGCSTLDFEMFVTGCIALYAYLKLLKKNDFKVSAFGTRFGVIWMLALYRKVSVVLSETSV